MKRFSGKSRNIRAAFIGIFAALSAVLLSMVEKAEVYGNSMAPYLKDGDCVLVEKFSYCFGEPDRFDVVIFRYRDEEKLYAKRIIGLPGETVQIVDGIVTINGEKLKEPTERELIAEPGRAADPVLLGEDEYFLLGDNCNDSSDSRNSDIGNVKKSRLTGRVLIRLP